MSGPSWSERLIGGLKRTSERLGENLSGLTGKSRLDDDDLDRIEEALITADLGPNMAARIRDINPTCELTVIREFLIPETVADRVPADVDFVIDCIDSLNCKVALVASSVERGLKVASSMGAGNKLDPTRIRIADISKTEMCPLASVMRKRLRKRGIPKGVLTVFSDEAGRPPLPPQPNIKRR